MTRRRNQQTQDFRDVLGGVLGMTLPAYGGPDDRSPRAMPASLDSSLRRQPDIHFATAYLPYDLSV